MCRLLWTLTYFLLTSSSIVFTACVNNVTGTSSPGSGSASSSSSSTSLTSGGHIHRTAAAIERVNKLWCYACDTMDDGQACVDVVSRNDTSLMKKCLGEEFICMTVF
uniref:GK21636 n=1 Tax=Drosophila willistoni TaxID=7260 RepID=B4MPB7_DROWI